MYLTGSMFIFKGIARNINEIRSMIGVTRCWVEEAHSITADGIQILRATVCVNRIVNCGSAIIRIRMMTRYISCSA